MKNNLEIEKIKQGDHRAFRRFFEILYPKLMALARRFVKEPVAEDLVQEVFLTLWEQKKTIQADNIQSYLCKWTQNKCLNYLKHSVVIEEYEAQVRIAEAREAFLTNSSDSNDTLKQIITQDLRKKIETAIRKLPPKCALAFRLCYFDDMTHKEIADRMGISPRTVEGHIRQGILLLRTELRDLTALLLIFNLCLTT
ncbi:MAG: RNA polymerase sigma-70 factor [Dysgonamonadaceae bacterium]|jgi:RNA polymerase sigma-70 factor (ECF subfamily)|nr:RNA polymerase sigma-70 factor [Dysgonamonadaceae bacterium]